MITTMQAATVLGIDIRTVQRHIAQGHLKATRYGRDYLIKERDLERFKQERKGRGRPRKEEE